MKHIDIYLAADTSFYDTHRKNRTIAYMLEYNGKSGAGAISVKDCFGNKAALMGLLAALKRLTAEVDVTVHVDSTYLEAQINRGNIYRWTEGTPNIHERAGPIRYHDEWLEVTRIINSKCPRRINAGRDMPADKLSRLKDCITRLKEERKPHKDR